MTRALQNTRLGGLWGPPATLRNWTLASAPRRALGRFLWPGLAVCFLLFNSAATRGQETNPPAATLVDSPRPLPPTPAAAETNTLAWGILKAASISSMDALDDKRKLVIGDRLSFRIVEDEDEPRPLIVTDAGDVEFPYVGRVPAEDKTCKDLALAAKAQLEKEYYYQATVIVALDIMARSHGKVYLTGAVRGPGPQEIPRDEEFTVTKAIMRAGGFTEFANQKAVSVKRKADSHGSDSKLYTINAIEVLEKGKNDRDMIVAPGDTIFVPERGIRLR